MEFISDPFFYVVGIPAVLIAGVSKSGFGGGLGVVAVPLMALAVSPQAAAAIMLPILCLMDLANVWAYRNRWDRRNMKILVPAALLGILVGTLSFSYLNEAAVKLIIAMIAIIFTLDHWLRGRKETGAPGNATIGKGTVLGALAGFTSFVAHAGGPPVSAAAANGQIDLCRYDSHVLHCRQLRQTDPLCTAWAIRCIQPRNITFVRADRAVWDLAGLVGA